MEVDRNQVLIAMAKARISDKALCKKSGVSRPTLATIKRVGGNPRPETVGKLAHALGVPVEALLKDGAAS